MADVSPVEALPPASRAYGELEPPTAAPRFGMAVDTERCLGCWTCAVICKSENDVPLGMWWNRVLTDGEALDTPRQAADGSLALSFVPLSCQHCDNAPCTKVCPVGATYHGEGGLVLMDQERCIGCRYCMIACPYGVRVFNWGRAERPAVGETGMVAARPVGTMEKCTMCLHRLHDAQVPSCVWSCPAGARIFGDLADPSSRVSTLVRERNGQRLLEERGTEPKVYYLEPRRRRSL
ncbi:MAG TPA: 4Fe-4S dicluster domain-containing protein [Candidatus Limnocylindrales bacterium]